MLGSAPLSTCGCQQKAALSPLTFKANVSSVVRLAVAVSASATCEQHKLTWSCCKLVSVRLYEARLSLLGVLQRPAVPALKRTGVQPIENRVVVSLTSSASPDSQTAQLVLLPSIVLSALQLRFSRRGRKKLPFYRLVAVDSRKRRDGRPLEVGCAAYSCTAAYSCVADTCKLMAKHIFMQWYSLMPVKNHSCSHPWPACPILDT